MLMTIQYHLAGNLQRDGQHAGSLEVYDELSRAQIGLFGHNHPDVAGTYVNIGSVYQAQAKYPEALDMYHKGLPIYEQVHGRNHPDTASTKNKYADYASH